VPVWSGFVGGELTEEAVLSASELQVAASGRPVDGVPMPARIARLPRNKVGYPIPWFVGEQPDGTFDIRIVDPAKHVEAVRSRLCWVCGHPLGAYVAFLVGPMCAINLISGEPPSHRDCAEYAVRVCPFLAVPGMRRRSRDEDLVWVPAAGEMNERNPGVVLLWVTRWYRPFRASVGNDGVLYELGAPTWTQWLREGRVASRVEVLEAMETGLATVLELCGRDDDPERSRAQVRSRYAQALRSVPA
jgi:hypothetical protein